VKVAQIDIIVTAKNTRAVVLVVFGECGPYTMPRLFPTEFERDPLMILIPFRPPLLQIKSAVRQRYERAISDGQFGDQVAGGRVEYRVRNRVHLEFLRQTSEPRVGVIAVD